MGDKGLIEAKRLDGTGEEPPLLVPSGPLNRRRNWVDFKASNYSLNSSVLR